MPSAEANRDRWASDKLNRKENRYGRQQQQQRQWYWCWVVVGLILLSLHLSLNGVSSFVAPSLSAVYFCRGGVDMKSTAGSTRQCQSTRPSSFVGVPTTATAASPNQQPSSDRRITRRSLRLQAKEDDEHAQLKRNTSKSDQDAPNSKEPPTTAIQTLELRQRRRTPGTTGVPRPPPTTALACSSRDRVATKRPRHAVAAAAGRGDDDAAAPRQRIHRRPPGVASKRNDEPPPEEPHAAAFSLPRTLELFILKDGIQDIGGNTDKDTVSTPAVLRVMGIDEAGRGPLAGPVVAAAVVMPFDDNNMNSNGDNDSLLVPGIIDSKCIAPESARQTLYDRIVALPGVVWAVAVVDAPTIDAVNILQATLLAMRMAATAVMGIPLQEEYAVMVVDEASIDQKGCYVVVQKEAIAAIRNRNSSRKTGESSNKPTTATSSSALNPSDVEQYFALIDGNRVPTDMPCRAQAVIKGDGREYCIAAASILAKVTRDRLMHAYDGLYPEYGLKQHKGYPTAMHMEAVKRNGASPIHRRTFAPLKHMRLDPETGRILAVDD